MNFSKVKEQAKRNKNRVQKQQKIKADKPMNKIKEVKEREVYKNQSKNVFKKLDTTKSLRQW